MNMTILNKENAETQTIMKGTNQRKDTYEKEPSEKGQF